MNEIDRLIAEESDEGVRVDKFLLKLLPESGLRERRRLIENGFVMVNGRSCRSGLKMFPGAEVVLLEPAEFSCTVDILARVKVVRQGEGFAAVFKPEGLHSAAIAGSVESSVEDCLPGIFAGQEPILANRLDYLTSGMLLVAFGVERENEFRAYEDCGTVDKIYHAKVYGTPEESFICKNLLDTADRKRTKVLDEQAPSERWSRVELLESYEDGTSLLEVRIAKGARHQIRAHLAHAGFPIVGDPVYGRDDGADRMYLHHREIKFSGFAAVCETGWE
ncbi:RluA family pseudouridine synthase [Desulfovibrio sp. JC010]|uniref:RluA family pseudouridine synthase n=1 Tax=Desulfovibrio sp. JC010 TaxID=2593641 RepID=UPI001EF1DA50|nr:RluA family pseudouridine synthase [Desulfovibrio sp. JC010]